MTRGICQSKDGLLSEVKECAKIEKHDCGVQYFENDEWVDVDAKSFSIYEYVGILSRFH